MNTNDNDQSTDNDIKLRKLRKLCGILVHELRNPLISVATKVDGTKRHLPGLVKAYREAERLKADIPYINPIILKLYENSNESLKKNVLDCLEKLNDFWDKVDELIPNEQESTHGKQNK
jgi:hypothetical protein